jgi:N-methylhydantoinase B/oxoprolinase/acetone carboxylase alpha subunit
VSEAVDMTARLESVIAAGERAAEAIREDALQQVDRYMDEVQEHADWLTAERVRLVSELTDELVAHAGAIRTHSQNLIAALEHASALVESQIESLAAAELARDQPSSTSRDASR